MNMEPLFMEMIAYYAGDPKQIQHLIKVHSFALRIGLAEHLDEKSLCILEAAAIVHDIGIKAAMEKYGSGDGHYQEAEGPAIAEEMLGKLCYPKDIIDRVCYLVGHHHTYTHIDGMDYQILVEADFLVNIYEGGMGGDAVSSLRQKVFKTKTGLKLCDIMFCHPA